MGSPTAMGVTGFQFITSVNTIKRDDETRKKVRSHARRQKLPSEPSSKPAAQKRASQKERLSKFRLNTTKTSTPIIRQTQTPPKSASPNSVSSQNESSPTTTFDELIAEIKVERKQDDLQNDMITNELAFRVAAELPSFSVLPIRTTPLTEKLFKWMICVCLSPQEKFVQKWFDSNGAPSYFSTYHSSFIALSFAMNPQGNWFDFITVDPAMTHGFMGLVAAMHSALAEWDDMRTIDFHRYETLKHINKRLNLEGRDNATVSDGVIVSVSLLVHIEAFIGSLPAARAHLMGLLKMVEMRGGILEGFRHSTLLQRALAWADFAYATASQSALSFPFIPTLASVLDIQNKFLSRSIMLNTASSGRGRSDLTIRNRETIELFEIIYSTTQAVNTFEFDKLESLRVERGQMSDSVYLVEYKLCNLEEMIRSRGGNPLLFHTPEMFENQPVVGYHGPTDLSDALVYASHLYLHMALRGQPPQARGHRLLVEALMASLCSIVIALDLLTDAWPLVSFNTMGQPINSVFKGRSPVEGWARQGTGRSVSSDGTPDSLKEESIDELHEDILLWILFVGSCAQVPASHSRDSFETSMDCRGFFLSSLRKYCSDRGILDKNILTTKLKSIVWLDSWCEKQLEMIWARIGTELGF